MDERRTGERSSSARHLALLSVGLILVVAAAAAVTLLEASVMYGRLEPPVGAGAVPGRWLFAAGAVLVPSILSACTVVPWVLFGLARQAERAHAAERDLARARSVLRRAEQVGRIGHWQIEQGPTRPRIEWSDAVFEMLGHPSQAFELTPELVLSTYHPDDRDRVRRALIEARETGEPLEFEARVLARDGSIRIVNTQGRAELDDAGRVASLFGVVRDVTEARERDAAVREQAELFRVITDGISEGVVVLDDQRAVVSWNPAATVLFGIPSEQARGQPFSRVVQLEEVDAGSATLDLLPTADRPQVQRFHCVDPRGRRRTLEVGEDVLEAGDRGHSILLIRDVTRRAEQERELRQRARYDELTELLNRGTFWRLAEEEVERARDEDRPLTLLVMDIDHFKSINDERGHPEGDRALASFARCCVERLRSTDLVGRIGGEEFGVLLVGADAKRGAKVAETLRATVEALVVEGSSGPFGLTVSIGLAEVDLALDVPLDDASLRADRALYRAKSGGRNRVTIAPRSDGAGPSGGLERPSSSPSSALVSRS